MSLAALVVVLAFQPSVLDWAWRMPGNNKVTITSDRVPQIGYAVPNAEHPPMLDDLRQLLDVLAGPDGGVFDFTNSLGIFYYLLDEPLPTTYFHVSMAVPEFAQDDLVAQLRRARPAVVAFDSTQVGLAQWDEVHNEVRHFVVSDYLLDGWTPVVRSHGVLLMLRNDLVGTMPALPHLEEPPQTEGLYSMPNGCEWGAAAAYLESSAGGKSIALSVDRPTTMRTISAGGWAYDADAAAPAKSVLLAVDGVVVATAEVNQRRQDLVSAIGGRGVGRSGFSAQATTPLRGRVAAYAVLRNGLVRPLQQVRRSGPFPRTLTMPDGAKVPVDAQFAQGSLDVASRGRPLRVSRVTAPNGTRLASFDLATFSAGERGVGHSHLELMDTLDSPPSATLAVGASSVPGTGKDLKVRVGSCLPWHGFRGTAFYLVQRGGRPVDQIRLSGLS